MKTENHGATLVITDIDRLSATNATWFEELAGARLSDTHRTVDVDLSHARFIDSDGLEALIAVRSRLVGRQGRVRLLSPAPMVKTMLKLLHLDRVFDIVNN